MLDFFDKEIEHWGFDSVATCIFDGGHPSGIHIGDYETSTPVREIWVIGANHPIELFKKWLKDPENAKKVDKKQLHLNLLSCYTWTYLVLLTTLLSMLLLVFMVSSLLMITLDILGCI